MQAPLLNELTYALLRRSRTMIRWSLYGLVHNRRTVSEEMVEEIDRLLDDPQAGRAWRSFQKNEVGWGGLRTDFSNRLRGLVKPTLLIHGAHAPGRAGRMGTQGTRTYPRLRVEGVL